MRGDEAVRALPVAYVVGLRLATGGATDEEIAKILGVAEASIPVLLLIGAAKLGVALREHGPPASSM